MCKSCLVYADDIIIFADTFERHIQRLDQVFQRLQRAGLELMLSKCKLF